MVSHHQYTANAFTQQFRINGAAYCYEQNSLSRKGIEIKNRKVIHDLDPSSYVAIAKNIESELFDHHQDTAGIGEIPDHPVVRVFDLCTQEFFWVHSDNMTPYVYDKSFRNSISASNLGTNAEQISKNLQQIFLQSKRWNCVLLLDEADVFVVQRGSNIEQNAIVAEFLRALEYFDGLLFMTTNRPDDIDDAIISRCAAIINYTPPCQYGCRYDLGCYGGSVRN